MVAYWAGIAESNGPLTTYGSWLDLRASIEGNETERQRYRGSKGNIFVELWTVHGGGHGLGNDATLAERQGTTQFALAMWEWLRTKKRN